MSELHTEAVLQLPKSSNWKCYMFGSSPNGYGMVYTPSEGCVPNRFVRWMMKICFDCTWVRTEPEPEEPSDQKLHGYWISTSPSGQLTRQQIDAFLDRHKDPEDARRFLQEAGLIDQYGELARPYRQEQS